ncbi:MAG: lysophospholipid acyltransferase family protein [Acholeplasmataceae bacterium]
MAFVAEIGRLVIKIMFHYRFDLKYTYHDFDPKTKKPYLLIGNHATQHDPLIVGMVIKRYPYPVANAFLYTSKIQKFLLTKVVQSISKRKGQSDAQTIRKIIRSIKDEKRPVMLFPEGNATYYGEQSPVDYVSTSKLIKKLGVDVIFVNIRGGYLSHPRWGRYMKNGHFHSHFYKLFSKEELTKLDVNTIGMKLENAMQFNDFKWNEIGQYSYPIKHRANGIEHYLYYCPICKQTQTLKGKNEHILCSKCGIVGTFDEHSQLKSPYESLVHWGNDQYNHIDKIMKKPIITSGLIYDVDPVKQKRKKIGVCDVTLTKDLLTIHSQPPIEMPMKALRGEVITRKHKVSFDYEQKTYNLLLKDPMLALHAIRYAKEN